MWKEIEIAHNLGVKIIELHTGNYCLAKTSKGKALKKLENSAEFANDLGIEVHAGHGINFETVENISKIKYISELNIGHFLIGESIFMGLEQTIRKMRKKMDLVR